MKTTLSAVLSEKLPLFTALLILTTECIPKKRKQKNEHFYFPTLNNDSDAHCPALKKYPFSSFLFVLFFKHRYQVGQQAPSLGIMSTKLLFYNTGNQYYLRENIKCNRIFYVIKTASTGFPLEIKPVGGNIREVYSVFQMTFHFLYYVTELFIYK